MDIDKSQKKLEQIKKNVHKSYLYTQDMRGYFNKMKKFVHATTIDNQEQQTLHELKIPPIQFNIVEPYVSRIQGEFSKNEVGAVISAKDNAEVNVEQINLTEGIIRNAYYESKEKNVQFDCLGDVLVGGFGCLKVFSDYVNYKVFELDMFTEHVNPTKIVYDPLSKDADKCDGQFFGELVAMDPEVLKEQYGDLKQSEWTYNRAVVNSQFVDFRWTYKDFNETVVIVCDYYEKLNVKKTLVELPSGITMLKDDYRKLVKGLEETGSVLPPPAIVRERKTIVNKIIRYKVIENQILEAEETELKSFPYVFIEGMPVVFDEAGVQKNLQRSYLHNAIGAQKLKNLSGQKLAEEIENLIMHKWVMPMGGIPDDHLDAYKDVQKAKVLMYNPTKKDDPSFQLPPPIIVQRPAFQRELIDVFGMCDTLLQGILGSYDGSIAKMTDKQVSGIAIQTASTLSNTTAEPIIARFVCGIASWARKIAEQIPTIAATRKSMPMMDVSGKRTFVNMEEERIVLNFDPDDLDIKIVTGSSFGLQQEKAMQTIMQLSKDVPVVSEFIGTEALDLVLDNVPNIRGMDEFKERSEAFMQQKREMNAQMQEAQMNQPNPEQLKQEVAQQKMQSDALIEQDKVLLDKQKLRSETMINMGKLALDKEKVRNERLKIISEIRQKDETINDDRIASMIDQSLAAAEVEQRILDAQFRRVAEEAGEEIRDAGEDLR